MRRQYQITSLRRPAEAHLQKALTLQKESSKINFVREFSLHGVKIPESIRGGKEVVEKNLTFAYDSVKIEEENKEVLECPLVTTS